MRRPLMVLAAGIPVSCVLMVVFISVPKYGATSWELLNALLIFGSFGVLFVAVSFYFAKKLTNPS
jgi:hypothetical protein